MSVPQVDVQPRHGLHMRHRLGYSPVWAQNTGRGEGGISANGRLVNNRVSHFLWKSNRSEQSMYRKSQRDIRPVSDGRADVHHALVAVAEG